MQEVGPVLVDLSMSLDGFIAGAHDGPENPLGDGGGRLFAWWSAGDVAWETRPWQGGILKF